MSRPGCPAGINDLSLGQQCAQTPSFPCWVCICRQPVPSQPHISTGMLLARKGRLPSWLSTAPEVALSVSSLPPLLSPSPPPFLPTWDWRPYNVPILLGGSLHATGSLALITAPLNSKQVQDITRSLWGVAGDGGSSSEPILPFLCPTFNLVRVAGIL